MLLDYFFLDQSQSDTHDGADHHVKKHYYYSRKQLKQLNNKLKERERLKLEAKNILRQQIETVIHGDKKQLREAVETIREELPELGIKQNIQLRNIIPVLQQEMQKIESELSALNEELVRYAIEAKRLREEDDIKAIMLAINAPFAEFTGFNKTRH